MTSCTTIEREIDLVMKLNLRLEVCNHHVLEVLPLLL